MVTLHTLSTFYEHHSPLNTHTQHTCYCELWTITWMMSDAKYNLNCCLQHSVQRKTRQIRNQLKKLIRILRIRWYDQYIEWILLTCSKLISLQMKSFNFTCSVFLLITSMRDNGSVFGEFFFVITVSAWFFQSIDSSTSPLNLYFAVGNGKMKRYLVFNKCTTWH